MLARKTVAVRVGVVFRRLAPCRGLSLCPDLRKAVSTQVLAVAEGVLQTMIVAKLKVGISILLTVSLGAIAATGLVAQLKVGDNSAANLVAAVLPVVDQESEPKPATDIHGDPLPKGAIARLGTTRFRARDGVEFLAYSPDGKQLVTRGGGFVTLWDANSGRKLAEFSSERVGPLAWRADGSGVMLVAEANGNYRIGDFTRESLKANPKKDEGVYFKEERIFPQPPDDEKIVNYFLSPDGKYLVAGRTGRQERARLLTVWEVEPGKSLKDLRRLRELGPQHGNCQQVIFDRDGTSIGVVSSPELVNGFNTERPLAKTMLFVLYDLATGKERYRRAIPRPRINSGRLTVALSPDARFLAVGGNDSVCRVYATDGKTEDVSFGEPTKADNQSWRQYFTGASAMAFVGDKVIAANMDKESLQVHDITSGRAIRPSVRLGGYPETIAVSPDGTNLATGGRSGAIRIFDVATGHTLKPATDHCAEPQHVHIIGDGSQVLTWGYGEGRLWETSSGRLLRQFSFPKFDGAMRVLPDGKTILARIDEKWRALDVATGAAVEIPASVANMTGWIQADAGDGRSVVFKDHDPKLFWDESVSIWDWPEWRLRKRILIKKMKDQDSRKMPLREARLAPDGKLLITWGSWGVNLWDADTGFHKGQLQQINSQEFDGGVAFLGDGRQFVIARVEQESTDANRPRPNRIGLWDRRSIKPLRMFDESGSQPLDVAADPGGYVVATAEWNGSTSLFEAASGQIRKRLWGHLAFSSGVAFTPDGNRLVTVSDDGTGLVWDVGLKSVALGKRPASDADLERAWETLEQRSAPAAYDAMITCASNPEKAVAFVQKRLRPVAKLDVAALKRNLANLESETFAVRERALNELERLGRNAVPAVRASVQNTESLEAKRRLASFLEKHDTGMLTPDELRAVRSVEFLEHAATPAASALLAELSTGEPSAELTIRAFAAKARLDGHKK
jgi:WD40 repeat protein